MAALCHFPCKTLHLLGGSNLCTSFTCLLMCSMFFHPSWSIDSERYISPSCELTPSYPSLLKKPHSSSLGCSGTCLFLLVVLVHVRIREVWRVKKCQVFIWNSPVLVTHKEICQELHWAAFWAAQWKFCHEVERFFCFISRTIWAAFSIIYHVVCIDAHSI